MSEKHSTQALARSSCVSPELFIYLFIFLQEEFDVRSKDTNIIRFTATTLIFKDLCHSAV